MLLSLGEKCDESDAGHMDMSPNRSGSAGYSNLETLHFPEKLRDKLKIEMNIRHRILVYSQPWQTHIGDMGFLEL